MLLEEQCSKVAVATEHSRLWPEPPAWVITDARSLTERQRMATVTEELYAGAPCVALLPICHCVCHAVAAISRKL